MKHKEVTIYDIAKELEVSPSTVSRALKGHYSIGKNTIEAVRQLATDKGYRPNIIASSLRSNKTNNIGIIISWINRPFISSLISGIEEEVNKAGYNVIMSQSHDSYEHEVANANALFNSRVSGLIVSLAMETTDFSHFNPFFDNKVPIIFVDRASDKIRADRVIIDNYHAAYVATEHLIQQGCTRIAHLGGQQIRNIYKERQHGYIDALKKYGLEVNEELIIHNNLSSESGIEAANYLFNLSQSPDGLFCANDTSAVSVIQVAKKKGIKIPEDLAIIGFNNDPISTIIEPQLSTIDHPAVDMGRISAIQIMKLLNKKNNEDLKKYETILLETKLLARESTNKRKLQLTV